MISFLYLFLAGLVGGLIAGLVGIGGGVVYVFIIPAALRYFNIPEQYIAQFTIANSIFAILFASASANYTLIRLKLFYRNQVVLISLMGVVTSILTLRFIVNTSWYSVQAFNLVLIVLLSYMLYATLLSAKKVFVTPPASLNKWKLSLVGAAGGFIAALSGLGGGIVIIPILNTLMKIDIKRASSISSGVIMVTALMMTLFNMTQVPLYKAEEKIFQVGYIILPIGLTLASGVIFASSFGVKLSRKLSSSTISYIYAVFLSIVILKKVLELFNLKF